MMDGRLLHRLRSERGTTLVEVIAAAIILVVIAGAVTSLLSNAQQQSGQSRVRAIAGDLAQSQLEVLRSQRFSDLVDLNETVPDVPAGGLAFDVDRTAEWDMQGAAGASGCTVAAASPEALRVRVSVDWDSNTRRPVQLDTLVAAPPGAEDDSGDYIVQVNRRDGTGVSSLPVSIAGPTPMTGTTDANGCVRFNGLEAGSYTVSFQRTSWVNVLHESAISDSVTVVAGETGNKTFEYDAGGGFNVGFRKRQSGSPSSVPQAVSAVQFVNAGLAVPGVLNTTSPANTLAPESKPMYPHTSQYQVKVEACPAAGSLGGVAVNPGELDPPTRTDLFLTQGRFQLRGVRALSGIDKTTFKLRAQSPCGAVLTTGTGLTGQLSNSPGNPDYWTTTTPLVVPPGPVASVCVSVRATAGGYYWARATDLVVAPGTDEQDADGRLYVDGTDFNLDIAAAALAPTEADACPAV